MGNLKSLVSIMFGTSFLMVSSFAQVNLDVDSIFLSIESSGDYIVQESSWLKLKSTIDFEMKTPPNESVLFWEAVRKHPKAQMEQHDIVLRNILSMAYNVNEEYRKAAYQHIENLPIYRSSEYADDTDYVVQLQQVGRNFKEVGVIDSAFLYLQRAADYVEEKEIKGVYGYHLIFADLYGMLNEFEKSKDSWKNAWKAIEEIPKHSDRGYFLYLACKSAFQDENQELFSFFLNRLNDYQKNKPLTPPKNHFPIFDFVYDEGDDVAIERLIASYDYCLSQKNVAGAYNGLQLLAQALNKNGKTKEAILRIEDLVKRDFELEDFYAYRLYFVLQSLYEKVGDYQNAFDAQTKFTYHRNEFVQDRVRVTTANAEVRYETEKKEKDLIKKEAELTSANQRIWLFGFAFLGLFGMTGLIYRNARYRKRINKELELKNGIISNSLQEKDVLLKEIHHRVKNNLQIVSSLLNLQSRRSKDTETKAAIDEGRNRVKSMSLIHQNLYLDVDKATVMSSDYITKLISSLFDSYQIDRDRITLNLSIDPVEFDVDTVIPIGLVLNELITNALKYAFPVGRKGSLSINLKDESSNYLLEIKDDGVGMESTYDPDRPKGIGKDLVDSFCQKLNAELRYSSTTDSGTQIIISIPKA